MCWHPNTFPQEMIHGETPANALLPLAPGTTIEAASPHPKPHQSIQTKQVLSAESQPQHRLPSLRPHRGWRELDSPACVTGTLL